jgi:hypothetical protein
MKVAHIINISFQITMLRKLFFPGFLCLATAVFGQETIRLEDFSFTNGSSVDEFNTDQSSKNSRTASGERVWEEYDGLVVIEAEHVEKLPSGVYIESSTPGYTGSGYLRFAATYSSSSGAVNYSKVNQDIVLTYKVYVNNPGHYLIKLRNYHQFMDGDNDCWVSVNQFRWRKFWDNNKTTWTYDEGYTRFYVSHAPDGVNVPLSAGLNTIQVAGRASGYKLDRIILQKGIHMDEWTNSSVPATPINLSQINDNNKPEEPGGLIANSTATTASLSWSAATDDQGVWRYVVYANGEQVGVTSATSITIRGLADNSSYNFTVRARDYAGNLSDASAPVRINTQLFSDYDDGALITLADGPIIIDGHVESAWDNTSPYQLTHAIASPGAENVTAPSSSGDLSGWFKVLWDSENLFFLVDITDDILKRDTDIGSKWDWHDDGIEIMVDADNSMLYYYDYKDFNYRFRINDGTVREVANWYEADKKTSMVNFAQQITSNGYRFEVRIPWAQMDVSPSGGDFIRIDVQVTDDDNGGERDHKLAWWDKDDLAYQFPIVLAEAKLLSSISKQVTDVQRAFLANFKQQSGNLVAHPNPVVHGFCMVDFGEKFSGDLILVNQLGQVVMQLVIEGEQQIRLNLNELSAGLYNLHAKGVGFVRSTRVINIK